MSLLNTLTFGLLKKIVAAVVAIFFASTILAVLLFKYVPVYITPLMLIRTMEQIKDGQTIAMHHHWVSMDKFPSICLSLSWRVKISASCYITVLTSMPYKRRSCTTAEAVRCMVLQQYHSRRQRMFSCGRAGAGCERDWRATLRS